MDRLKHNKMVDVPRLLGQLDTLRREGKRIVFTNGCFDIIHPGHVDLLAKARQQGDVLVMGLNSDDSVRRQGKGEGRPFNPYEARAFVLAHLESINFVVPFNEDTPLELIRKIRPHILVKGGDYTPETVVGRDIVEADGGRVVIIPFLPGWSTTTLATRIVTAHSPVSSPESSSEQGEKR